MGFRTFGGNKWTRTVELVAATLATLAGSDGHGAQTIILRISWALTWAIPLVALVVGIVLTATGSAEVWTPLGDDTFDVTMLAVWPAGIALMAVGVLCTTAAAIATAVSAKR